jgi:hypothetical protein
VKIPSVLIDCLVVAQPEKSCSNICHRLQRGVFR